jgi:hypothetical protein
MAHNSLSSSVSVRLKRGEKLLLFLMDQVLKFLCTLEDPYGLYLELYTFHDSRAYSLRFLLFRNNIVDIDDVSQCLLFNVNFLHNMKIAFTIDNF